METMGLDMSTKPGPVEAFYIWWDKHEARGELNGIDKYDAQLVWIEAFRTRDDEMEWIEAFRTRDDEMERLRVQVEDTARECGLQKTDNERLRARVAELEAGIGKFLDPSGPEAFGLEREDGAWADGTD